MAVLMVALSAQLLPGLGLSSSSVAVEEVPINTVLKDPESYHLKLVMLRGTVHHVHILEPHDPPRPDDPCFGSYTFILQDDTAFIEVEVAGDAGRCQQRRVPKVDVSEGDNVWVEAQIDAPGYYINAFGFGENRETTRARAFKIWPMK